MSRCWRCRARTRSTCCGISTRRLRQMATTTCRNEPPAVVLLAPQREFAGAGVPAIPLILTVLRTIAAGVAASVVAGAAPATAHGGGDVAQGFVGGFLHPLTGPD